MRVLPEFLLFPQGRGLSTFSSNVPQFINKLHGLDHILTLYEFMNAALLHLTFNHVPVIGLIFSLAILIIGRWLRSDTTQRVGLWMLFATALFAIPTFLTGEPAEDIAQKFPGVEKAFIEEHEDAAGWALGSAIAAGLAAGVVLFVSRKRTIPTWGLITTLFLSVISAGGMAWTAHLGGLIRHPEIRSALTQPNNEIPVSHAD